MNNNTANHCGKKRFERKFSKHSLMWLNPKSCKIYYWTSSWRTRVVIDVCFPCCWSWLGYWDNFLKRRATKKRDIDLETEDLGTPTNFCWSSEKIYWRTWLFFHSYLGEKDLYILLSLDHWIILNFLTMAQNRGKDTNKGCY